MMVTGGLILGDRSTYDYWDSSLLTNPAASTMDNKGCAPGWATIYVVDSLTGEMVRVCRRLDEAIMGPGGAAIIAEESGPDWYDQATINVAAAAEEVVQGTGTVLNALSPALTSTALVIGAIALLLFAWKRP
jgi:hypothetical protein